MKVIIFAAIWSHNLGDELILKNEVKLLEKEYGTNTEFVVFSYEPHTPFFTQDNIVYKEYFPIGTKKITNIFKNIKNFFSLLISVYQSDICIIWWWGIIYDGEKQLTKAPLDQWLFRVNIFRLLNKPFRFFALGLNIHNTLSYPKVKDIFVDANQVSVRNIYSLDLLHQLWIKAELVHDPVYFDDWWNDLSETSPLISWKDSHDFSIGDLAWIDFNGKKVGIAFRRWYLEENEQTEEEKMNQIIDFILDMWWHVVFLPHSFHKTDYYANDFVYLNRFVREWTNMSILWSCHEVYDVYKNWEIDICISMRLHSIILSHVYSIPFVWVSYSVKTQEALKEMEK